MGNRSFRDILSDFLEESAPEATAEPPPRTTFHSSPFYFWQPSAPQTAKSQNPYCREEKPKPRPAKSAPAPEPLVALDTLSASERAAVQILIDLGAEELLTGLSASRVKKAYRKLVKRLHPDRLLNAPVKEKALCQEQFLLLQGAYESLEQRISVKASDSESASAPGSRRPAAA